MPRAMLDAKLIRVSTEAHHAARIGAAIEDMKLEDWASWALVEMSKQVRAQGFHAPSGDRIRDMGVAVLDGPVRIRAEGVTQRKDDVPTPMRGGKAKSQTRAASSAKATPRGKVKAR